MRTVNVAVVKIEYEMALLLRLRLTKTKYKIPSCAFSHEISITYKENCKIAI